MAKIRPLSKELQHVAKVELNEDPERIDEYLKTLREWIAKTPYLKARTEDTFLIVFLRGCKFNLEKAKAKLDAFYTNRAKMPEVFKNRKVTPGILEIARSGCLTVLPRKNGPTGPSTVLVRPGLFTKSFRIYDVLKLIAMAQDMYLIEDDHSSVVGCTLIVDLDHTPLWLLPQLSVSLVKQMMLNWFQGNPSRFKAFYVVNMKTFLSHLLNLMKKFLPEKLRSRVGDF